jgi:peptidoglycan-N-acetylglucosamine deacetylase
MAMETSMAEKPRQHASPKFWRRSLVILTLSTLLALVVGMTLMFSRSAKAASPATVVTQGPTNVPQVAITFDDGPSTYTPQVLSILQQYGAHSTFFLWGQHVQQYPQYAKQEVSAGMEVGNHTWDHTDLTTLSSSAITSELSQAQSAIQQATGATPTLMRPPNGNYNSTVLSAAGSLGLSKVIIWSYVAGDYTNPQPSASDISSRVLSNTSNGSIILLHDGGGDRSNTVAALPSIIQGLQSRGLKLVTVSQLLSGTPPPPTNTPTATPRPGTPTPTATPRPGTPTPTPTQGTGGACKVAYAMQNQWTGGFTANITITNTSSAALNGWTLNFAFPATGQSVTQGWSATWSQSGQNVTATNLSYNGNLAAGASISIGFNGAWSGSNPSPTSFTLNGTTCTNG